MATFGDSDDKILLFNNNGLPESNRILLCKNMLTKKTSHKENKEKALINKVKCFRWGSHCAIYSTFTPHFMCWKYFGECFMDKNLLHIYLTKFNKLSKRT